MKSKANTRQPGGIHYLKHGELQPWDVVIRFNLDFFQGTIFKYLVRWKDKNGLLDLEKAAHYLEKYIESEKEKQDEIHQRNNRKANSKHGRRLHGVRSRKGKHVGIGSSKSSRR